MLKNFLLALMAVFFNLAAGLCADVVISGEKGAWELLVDNKPFYIKGAGCGLHKGSYGEDYLKLAKELGANCVRTWGIDQGTKEYLEAADKYGLKVACGIWINYASRKDDISFISGGYREKKKDEVLAYVEMFKDHPAVLIWGVGNECVFFTKAENEKIALAEFIEELAREIHRIDPKHPVMYASAGAEDIKYIRDYAPSVDIIGMNVYPSLRPLHGRWDYLKIDRPYILSEFGPPIPYISGRDDNGASIEVGDKQKAVYYRELITQMYEFKGYNLGGFAHHLGETTQESMTWWNINYSRHKNYPYWAVYQLYTREKPVNLPPLIKIFRLDKTKVKPGQFIGIEFSADDPENDALRYEVKLGTTIENVLRYYVNEFIDAQVEQTRGGMKIKAPHKEGIFRVYLFAYDGKGNVSSASKSVFVR